MAEKKGSSSEKTLYCSFCGKSQHEVKKLIAGPSVFVCDECIELCNDIIRDEVPASTVVHGEGRRRRSAGRRAEIKSHPRQLRDRPGGLAKRTLAVAVYNHYKRLRHIADHKAKKDEVELAKSNILLIGPNRLGQDACWRRRSRACSTCPS